MKLKFCLVISICLICTGCKTFQTSLKKNKSIPVITAINPAVETETVMVPAKTKKVWVNPYIDDEGNMIEGHYKYVILEESHWALQEITPQATCQVKQNTLEVERNNE
ncbi:MAG: TraV family lipoprotein [Candidatus Omnitrophica bacterium]|nr:TraV family lipoprotein [Candidatus Omnitrophota bacterium]